MASLINKIGVATVFGKIKAKDIDGKTPIMRVIGAATAMEQGQTAFGDYTALIGEFKATSLKTGEVFMSGKCFLPDVANNLVVGALNNAQSVEFAFDIFAVEDETSSVGYVYTAEPLVSQSVESPVARIEALLPPPPVVEKAAEPESKTKKSAKETA